MNQNNRNFSIEDAKRLAESEEGKKLYSLLQSQEPNKLRMAMQQATAGDFEQLKKTLGTFMASQEAQSLLKQMENKHE